VSGNLTITGQTDPYTLDHGGHVALGYILQDTNASDFVTDTAVVHGFHVGDVTTDIDADTIDLSDALAKVLAAGNPSLAPYADQWSVDDKGELYVQGFALSGHNISDYFSTSSDGVNTSITVAQTPLITLTGVSTDLPTLLANHQIVVGTTNGTVQEGELIINGRSENPYILENGGHVAVTYQIPNDNGTFVTPVVEGFHVGDVSTDADADTIDLSDVFIKGFSTSPDVAPYASQLQVDTNGAITAPGNDLGGLNIADMLTVTSDGTNTTLIMSGADLMTLKGVSTDLHTLLVNHQLVV
jgi:hypothetical protein